MSIHILLADDHALFLSGLCALLQQQPDLEVVAMVKDGQAAVDAAIETKPHIALIDVSMPVMNGIEATRLICELVPTVRVLCLSMHHEKQYVLSALKVGAAGYLLKDSAFDEVLQAIHCVRSNQTYLSPSISNAVVEAYLAAAPQTRLVHLTSREREVLLGIVEGLSTNEIAERLFVTVKTIHTHRSHLMEKLDCHNVVELTKYAIREGLTSIHA